MNLRRMIRTGASLWFGLILTVGLLGAGCQTIQQQSSSDEYLPAVFQKTHYFVGGQVRSPGRYAYLGPTTVLKAIAEAESFTDFANRKEVILTRVSGQSITVNCDKAAKDAALDFEIYPGDKIIVPLNFVPDSSR